MKKRKNERIEVSLRDEFEFHFSNQRFEKYDHFFILS